MAADIQPAAVTARGRYEALATERRPYEQRARAAATLTIPGLFPPQGANGATTLYEPFQSTGADGVNNLASKLLLAMFPPGSAFFRLSMDDFVVEALEAQAGEDGRATFEEALAKIERSIMSRREESGARTVDFEAFQHLIVAGNGLVHVLDDGREKFFRLDQYVVKRDLDGNVLDIVVKETLARRALPLRIQVFLNTLPAEETGEADGPGEQKNIEIFTWIRRTENGGWAVMQEIAGREIPGSRGRYPADKCPWLPLRWRRVSGEDYGRSHCDEYIGDLRTLESLTKFTVEFAGAASKIVFLVNENGVTDLDQLNTARSGDFVPGDPRDIQALMLDKVADFQLADKVREDTKQRLEKAFLLASAVQRNAERVTAEEIRAMIGELENSLGGVYSILAEEYQRPLVVCLMAQLAKSGKLPHLPKGAVAPKIVTGLDGLGRNSDLQKLDVLLSGIAQTFGPEALTEYVNVGAYMKLRAAALSLDINGLVRSDEEVAAAQQAAAQQSITEKVAPSIVGAVQKGAELAAPKPPSTATS